MTMVLPGVSAPVKPRLDSRTVYRIEWALFVLPALGYVIVSGVIPLIAALATGFFQTRRGVTEFVGFRHYEWALAEPAFWNATVNSFLFTGFTVLGHLLIGLGFALLLNQKIRALPFWRGVQFAPWLFPPAAVSILWVLIYQDQFGALNSFLRSVGLSDWTVNWLGTPGVSLAAVTVASIWNWYPFLTLTLLAALQNIPEEFYEAIEIDGGGTFAKFRHVTVPHILPVVLTICVLDFFWTFRFFDMIWIMTRGGPGGSSEVLATYTYKLAFQAFRFDRAAAVGGMMLVFMAILAAIYLVAYRWADDRAR